MRILFLDDDSNRIPLLPKSFNLHYVRSPSEFMAWLEENGTPDIISFDHDLAPEHYVVGYTSENEGNGEDCARWAIENNFIPNRVIVHSWNSQGAQRIALRFKDIGHKDIFVKAFNPRVRHDWKE